MKPFLFSAAVVYLSATLVCAAPSSGRAWQSQQQSQSDANKPATQSSTPAPSQTSTTANGDQDKDKQDKTKKKPKKVWTNDEISTVSGGISVVGDSSSSSSSASAPASRKSTESDSDGGGSAKEKQVAAYRDQIQKLRAQIDAADKKINDLRNFKADNTSPSGGINMNKGYNMTPLEDQVKQLEEQKKQIQAKIDALEDEARKNGIGAGELR